MKISVIIPTYNEEDVILKCLDSFTSQSFKDFEVIVVDDGSDDNTIDLLNNLEKLDFDLKVLQGKHEGAGAARNLGVTKANGDILVFVDADMTFDHNFLKMLVKPVLIGKSKGSFSKDEYVSNWDSVWARCWNINEGWENKKRHPKKYPNTQKVFRAILKDEFNRVGGFTPGGYNDDWSLSQKLGYEASLSEKAIFYHKNPSTLAEIYKHAKWVGKRQYKFGLLGSVYAILRVCLPISIIVGLYKSLINKTWQFLIFKIIYDFGVLMGILNYMFTKKGSK